MGRPATDRGREDLDLDLDLDLDFDFDHVRLDRTLR
jgi:hypothetical protein